jgi:putative membrane protein
MQTNHAATVISNDHGCCYFINSIYMHTLNSLRKSCLSRLPFVILVLALISSCGHKDRSDSIATAEKQDEDMASVNNDSEVKDDYDFAVEAADGNLLEVQLGELAISKAYSDQVKRLGQMMVSDHSKCNDELRKLVHEKNVVLPNSLSEKSQQKFSELNLKQGSDFDKAYSTLMIDAHTNTMKAFKKEADKGKDPDLKSFAAGKMPILEHHIEMSQAAKKAVENSKE